MVRDTLTDEDDFEFLDFVGSIGMVQGVDHVTNMIARVLDI